MSEAIGTGVVVGVLFVANIAYRWQDPWIRRLFGADREPRKPKRNAGAAGED